MSETVQLNYTKARDKFYLVDRKRLIPGVLYLNVEGSTIELNNLLELLVHNSDYRMAHQFYRQAKSGIPNGAKPIEFVWKRY